MSSDEYRAARELEAKFQFYFTALAFTILGLAIQTAPHEAPRIAQAFELVAWTLLLAAGLLSLWYLEAMPRRRTLHADLAAIRAEIEARRRFRGRQSEQFADASTQYLEHDESQLEAVLSRWDKKQHRMYRAARYLLFIGLIATGIARGFPLAKQVAGMPERSSSEIILRTPN